MKIKLYERIAMVIYAVLGLACTACIGLAIWMPGLFSDDWLWGFVIGGFAAVILLSIRSLRMAFRREPGPDKTSVSVQNTEDGSVRISVQAMDTLVKQAIGHTEGVAAIKTHIINHEDSITVQIEMTLESDVHIPNITMLMQRSIKNFIEEYSGIAVREVTVMITDIVTITPQPPLALEEKKPDPVLEQAADFVDEAPETKPEAEIALDAENEAAPDAAETAEPERAEPEAGAANEADWQAEEAQRPEQDAEDEQTRYDAQVEDAGQDGQPDAGADESGADESDEDEPLNRRGEGGA